MVECSLDVELMDFLEMVTQLQVWVESRDAIASKKDPGQLHLKNLEPSEGSALAIEKDRGHWHLRVGNHHIKMSRNVLFVKF